MSATRSEAAVRARGVAAYVELLKPITWFAPMWAFGCGVVSGGGASPSGWLGVAAGIALAGPLVCGTSQAANDWFDRHVDAINEPDRPIPSGRVPGRGGLYLAIGWTLLSALVAAALGPFVLAASVIGLALAWAYSAPPVRLKMNGWWGNSAVAVCYEGLPWVTGAAVVQGSLPSAHVFAIAALYSIGAHGIMTLNDFKSVLGDSSQGIRTLPVQLGVVRAGHVACLFMSIPQVVVVALLFAWGRPVHAAAVAALLAAQVLLMARLLKSPRERAPWYNATGTTLYVAGMMISAFALAASSIHAG
ncbi:MAG: chlorophyll synthase ChlG [Proteobacteria bacterium]|nr:chlorophyll synthase ChlG [Pseudomonadota bacterium]